MPTNNSKQLIVGICPTHKGCGCEDISTCCFECPLPICRFDVAREGKAHVSRRARNAMIREMHGQGVTSTRLHELTGLSEGSIFRICSNGR